MSRSCSFLGLPALIISLVGCAGSDGPPSRTADSPARAELGHRVALPKGGGRYVVGKPHFTRGRWYTPHEDPGYDRTGVASWYGRKFHGRQTANGETYDMLALTAAHPTLPMPSHLEVTNLHNGRKLVLRLNDRGPFVNGRIIDVSWRAAELLGFAKQGTARVRVRYLGRAPLDGNDAAERRSAARLMAGLR